MPFTKGISIESKPSISRTKITSEYVRKLKESVEFNDFAQAKKAGLLGWKLLLAERQRIG